MTVTSLEARLTRLGAAARARSFARPGPGTPAPAREGGEPPSLPGATRVIIAEDDVFVRQGLRTFVEADPTFHVVAEAGDGLEAVDAVRAYLPEIVLVDIRMPHLSGLDVAREVLATGNPPHVVILTTFGSDDYVEEALRIGAAGFLLKDTPPHELVDAIRRVAAGEVVLSPAVVRMVCNRLRAAPCLPHDDGRLDDLTPRELDVLRLVGLGLTNHEISLRLHVSESTVKTYIGRMLAKFRLTNRVQLALFAHHTGLTQQEAR